MKEMSKIQRGLSCLLKLTVILSAMSGTFLSWYAGRNSFMGGKTVFMFFTIQSNIALAIICLIGFVIMLKGKQFSGFWYIVKFVGTVSITLTGAVFCFVLAPTMQQGAWNIQNILTAEGCASNNGTKAVPCCTADLFGDWREELILRTEDNTKLRIWCTNTETSVRLTTLMHDAQYRMQCGCQQSSYNQPPHTSFFLGTGYDLPARQSVKLNNVPPEPVNGKLIKNFLVKDTANYYSWKLMDSNKTGGPIYGDRDFTYTALAPELENCEYIMTACNSKNTDADLAEFTVDTKAEVYVLVDTREEAAGLVPSWLGGYTRTDLTARSSNEVDFVAYKKTFEAGEKVVLGTNGMTGNVINYTVFVKEPEIVTTTTTTTTTTTETTTTTTTETTTTTTTTTTTETTSTTTSETTTTTTTDTGLVPETTTTAPETEINWGDANCDSEVNMADAVFIMQSIANPDKYKLSEQGEKNADVNGTGDGISNKDALTIQRFKLGLITKLPE